MRSFLLAVAVLLLVSSAASATSFEVPVSLAPGAAAHNPWASFWLPSAYSVDAPAAVSRPLFGMPAPAFAQADPQPVHAAAVEHSDAYQTRAKIHKIASFATLPLFAAEVALGQSLYNDVSNPGTRKAAHAAVGAGIIGLFGVNTVTGAWNLFGEGRQDKQGRTLRLVHGLLMMAADAGFLATWAAGPNSEGSRHALTYEADKTTHRNLAIASISVGTAGYLLMLFGNH